MCYSAAQESQREDTLDPDVMSNGFRNNLLFPEMKSALQHTDFIEKIKSSDNLTDAIARDLNKVLERQKSQITRLSVALMDPCAKIDYKDHIIMKSDLLKRWFNNLAGDKPLKSLCTSVPYYSKKVDVIRKLQDLEVLYSTIRTLLEFKIEFT